MTTPIQKKRLVASIHNLSPELQEAVKTLYPTGFSEAMIRIEKPNGDFFYAVPFETDEVAYLVKIDVKIDDVVDDDDDKEELLKAAAVKCIEEYLKDLTGCNISVKRR